MKINNLTHKQLIIIFNKCPQWVADHNPLWALKNKPQYMKDHKPNWLKDYSEKWIFNNIINSPEIPKKILKLLEE